MKSNKLEKNGNNLLGKKLEKCFVFEKLRKNPDLGFFEGRCFMQPAALKALHWNLSVWCRTRARGGGELVLCRFRPSVDSPSKSQWGSILLLVRDLAPYSTPLLLRTLSP